MGGNRRERPRLAGHDKCVEVPVTHPSLKTAPGAVTEVSRDWQPTWRINAVTDAWVMENEKDDIPANFVLRLEEIRKVRDIGGGEVTEIRWRAPTKAEVREVVRRYHEARIGAKPPDVIEFQKQLRGGPRKCSISSHTKSSTANIRTRTIRSSASAASGPPDARSPLRSFDVIHSSKPKNGATKSLHNRSPPKPISQPPLTTYQMLVSLSKNSPATNSHRPVATIATTITNRRAVRINSSSVQRGVLEIDAGERPPGGVGATKMRLGLPARAAFY
jgi:hypothetical protein